MIRKSPGNPPCQTRQKRLLFFDVLIDAKLWEFDLRYAAEAKEPLLGAFRHLHTDIYGNREFVEHLSNGDKLYHEEKRERSRILIDYDNLAKAPHRSRSLI